jgi:topoisomerase IA-like protein
MKEGFIVGTGTYAAIPFGNQLMVIYNGEQLKVCRTENSARNFIAEHKRQNKATVPVKKPSTKSSTSNKKPLDSKSPTKKPNGRPSKRKTV